MLTERGDRLEILEISGGIEPSSFAADAAAGLGASQKHLPSKYFYDDLGSALFEAITHVPEYYLTQAEHEILRDSGWEMVRALGGRIELLELGSGSAQKTRLLIEETLRVQGTLRYSPIDIAANALRETSQSLVAAYAGLAVRAYVADYFHLLEREQLTFTDRVLVLFMGSNLGNYAPDATHALLASLFATLRSGDGLLLGVDLKKDPARLELAYNDLGGVTAAFDKNLLTRINRELGGAFELRDFEHCASYDEVRGSVDSYLVARRACRVTIERLGQTFAFADGERIHTESSYKYDPGQLSQLADEHGFALAKTWTDRQRRFAVVLFAKP